MRPYNQFGTIKGLTRTLGLSDEEYRNLLWDNFQVRSSKALNFQKRELLITSLRNQVRALENRAPAAGEGWKKYEDLAGRPGMATPAQLRKIEAMWWGVSKLQPLDRPEGLQHWLRNRFQIMGILQVQTRDVQRVIRALEEMVKWKQEADAKAAKEKAIVAAAVLEGGAG
jgi:hypothetical protein